MPRFGSWMLAITLAVLAWAGTTPAVAGPPERVEPMRKKMFSRPEYVKLRDEWKAWAEAHPTDAHAWAQLAKAGSYAGDLPAVTGPWAEKAYQLDPDDPDACTELARHRWSVWTGQGTDSPDEAIRLLEHALVENPDCDDAHVRLWVLRLARGDRGGAERELATLLDRGRIPEPLCDFAYNELVGLAPHAILFTNGDNDTYPAIALQVARGFRTDVTVVNLSMLTLEWYRRALRQGPDPVPVPLLEGRERDFETSTQAMQEVVRAALAGTLVRPVYVAVTVPMDAKAVGARLSVEGLVYRTKRGALETVADTARLQRNFGETYRLQSATSPALDWNAWSALRPLVTNYGAGEWMLAKARVRAGNRVGASRSMNDLLGLATFHHSESTHEFLDFWRGFDPHAPELARWTKLAGSTGGR